MTSETPVRPDTKAEPDEETKRILDERLRTFDEAVKQAVPAEQVIREGRAQLTQLKHPAPK